MFAKIRFILLLAVLLPNLGHCREAAIATGSGNARLNGKALVRTSAVFEGDELQTAEDSAIVLHGKGFSVQVGPLADSILQKNSLRLAAGTVQAKGLIDVIAGDIRILSDSGSTMYIVSRLSGTVNVTAKAGLVIVRRGRERFQLKAGQRKSFAELRLPTPSQKQVKGRSTAAKTGLGVGASSAIGAVLATHLRDTQQTAVSPACP